MSLIPHLKYSGIPENSQIRRFKYITFQGGGVKGVGFVGAIEELESCGVMDQIEEVAGSSAGAIVATLVALGYNAREIRQEMMALNFTTLQDKEQPGWVESSGIKEILLHGGFEALKDADKYALLRKLPAVKKIASIASLPGRAIAATEKIEDILEVAFGSDLGLWKGEALVNLISRLVARKTGNPNLTFADLANLAEKKPGKFRALHLTGSNLTIKRLEIYNASNWPEMRIIDAVRISASFPGAFRPFIQPLTDKEKKDFKEEDPKKRVIPVRVDGGLLQNLPDVFNHPPYHNPTEHELGNPEVLALSFLDPESKKPPKFRTGLDLAKALYSTVMSEEELREKYKGHIGYIDPKKVGTLEFDAPLEKRLALANSGGEAIKRLFAQMIDSEKVKKKIYEEMSIDELMRNKIALQRILRQKNALMKVDLSIDPLMADLRRIDQLLGDAKVPPENLKELEEKEIAKVERRLKGVSHLEHTDKELADLCYDKINELTRVQHELHHKYRQLKLVKLGFEMRMQELAARHLHRGFQNEFVEQLEKFADFQNLLKKNRDEMARLEIHKNAPDSRMTNLMFEKRRKEIDGEYAAIMHGRELYFRGVLASVFHDGLMHHFFEELQEDCRNINFVVPTQYEQVIQYYKHQVKFCKKLMKEVKVEIVEYNKKKESFTSLKKSFERRGNLIVPYETLMELKTELDRSINKKTGLIAKVNNYLVDASPRLKNITTTAMQIVAFCAVVIRASMFLPLLSFGIANLIKRYSPSNSKLRSVADRVIEWFKMPNLFRLNKLREFKKMAGHLIAVINDNYAKTDTKEHSYLYRLLAYHLKNTGLEIKEIFPKKDEETDSEYNKRIKFLTQRLKYIAPETIEISQSNKAQASPSNRNFEELSRYALQQTLKETKQADELKASRDEKNIHERAYQAHEWARRNMQLVHKEFLQRIEEKLKRRSSLTTEDVVEYVDSAKALHKKVPESVMLLYLRYINNKVDRQKMINALELKHFKEFSKALKQDIPDSIRAVQIEIERKKYEEEKDKQEFKEDVAFKKGLEIVINRQREHRASEKKPVYHPKSNKPRTRKDK